MLLSGAWGKVIHEKNLKQKISWHCPFNQAEECIGMLTYSHKLCRSERCTCMLFLRKVTLKFWIWQHLGGNDQIFRKLIKRINSFRYKLPEWGPSLYLEESIKQHAYWNNINWEKITNIVKLRQKPRKGMRFSFIKGKKRDADRLGKEGPTCDIGRRSAITSVIWNEFFQTKFSPRRIRVWLKE